MAAYHGGFTMDEISLEEDMTLLDYVCLAFVILLTVSAVRLLEEGINLLEHVFNQETNLHQEANVHQEESVRQEENVHQEKNVRQEKNVFADLSGTLLRPRPSRESLDDSPSNAETGENGLNSLSRLSTLSLAQYFDSACSLADGDHSLADGDHSLADGDHSLAEQGDHSLADGDHSLAEQGDHSSVSKADENPSNMPTDIFSNSNISYVTSEGMADAS